MIADYESWCDVFGCEHGHCPFDHEHPQPFVLEGVLYCGYCWFRNGEMTEMVPCRPENCA